MPPASRGTTKSRPRDEEKPAIRYELVDQAGGGEFASEDPEVFCGKKIKSVSFGLLGPREMERIAEFEACNFHLYQLPLRSPAKNGCLDTRLGAATKAAICGTCRKKMDQCAGHFGVVKLAMPVFHAGYFKHVVTLLQCICKSCSRCLLSDADRESYLRKMRRKKPFMDALKKASIFKRVVERCKQVHRCPHCKAANGPVRKIAGSGALKAAHEKWKHCSDKKKHKDAPDTTLEEDDPEFRAFAKSLRHLAVDKDVNAVPLLRPPSGKKDSEKNEDSDSDDSTTNVFATRGRCLSENLSPADVKALFEGMPDDDCELLWMDPKVGRPEDLILSSLLVPPTPIRPSVAVDAPMSGSSGGPGSAGSNEDDLTVKLSEIIQGNDALRHGIQGGGSVKMIVDAWNFLQIQVALYVNGELSSALGGGSSTASYAKPIPIRGLCQRLKGKSGRFRGNLSGKRVDFSARTVISPDPNLRVDQVGVPVDVAKTMTYPEKVTDRNLAELQHVVTNGPDVHPGANYVAITPRLLVADRARFEDKLNVGQRTKKSLVYGNRSSIASELKPGDVVERHVRDGDIVLFNRQPSLHKMSIMAHKVKVMDGRTFRFNECCCAPYNADFDGDEMNMHLPQTEEARAEAAVLMPSKTNVRTPRDGVPLIAATQDFITACYLLTQRDVFLHREAFCGLCAYAGDASERVDVPEPSILWPVRLWTGKQVFSALILPSSESKAAFQASRRSTNGIQLNDDDDDDERIIASRAAAFSSHIAKRISDDNNSQGTKKIHKYVTTYRGNNSSTTGDAVLYGTWPTCSFEVAERNYSGSGEVMCPNDGYVVVRRSKLLFGNVAKKTIGDGSKRGLVYALDRDHGSEYACRAMNRIAKLASRYLGYHRGFSIGIGDVTPSDAVTELKERLVKAGDEEARRKIAQYNNGTLALKPGCDLLQSLESDLTGLLGQVREQAGKNLMLKELPKTNSPRIMAECGAKGSALNISQMIACLGQQAVDGKRIANGFVDRTLPHFEKGALEPGAKGFVKNSFFTGLTATEFFFHTMGGREGLVDTAVKTAQTGYMARRLMKALEDLSLHYDGTVRNSEANIVQLVYGADGLDPAAMEANDGPVDFGRLLCRIVAGDLPHTTEDDGDVLMSRDAVKRAALDALEAVPIVHASKVAEESYEGAPPARAFRDELVSFLDSAVGQPNDELHRKGKPPNAAVLLTPGRIKTFVEIACAKYERSAVEAGEAVGAIGAQCISEPGTQMTLKTFHFAGVASMNVTLGVPRLTEIINAAKQISTPIITAHLCQAAQKEAALVVKGRLEKTELGEICESINEVYSPSEPSGKGPLYIEVRLDPVLIGQLNLDVTLASARRAVTDAKVALGPAKCPPILRAVLIDHILTAPTAPNAFRVVIPRVDPPHCTEHHAWKPGQYYQPTTQTASAKDSQTKHNSATSRSAAVGESRLRGDDATFFAMQALKAALPKVVVAGIPSVNRVVVNEERGDDQKTKYHLLVEGYGLETVLGSPGVDPTSTTTNHVAEVEATLGIEAARSTIASEISYIMKAYGIAIDPRHLALLSDVMTFKGNVLGITRFGVSKMRESVLMLASFERTTDHLFDAAVHGRKDNIVGVSECIIMGINVPVGTASLKVLHDPDQAAAKGHHNTQQQRRRRTILAPSSTSSSDNLPSKFLTRGKRHLIMHHTNKNDH